MDRLIKNSDVALYVSHQVVKDGRDASGLHFETCFQEAITVVVQGSETRQTNAKLLQTDK